MLPSRTIRAPAVTFTLGLEALSLVDLDIVRVVEPWLFDVMVGASSANLPTATLDLVRS